MSTKIENEWRDFHVANPEVYRMICEHADKVIALGHAQYGIATIWELIRWHKTAVIRTAKAFRLPNNFRAYYARQWLSDHPQYPGFFRVCALRSAGEGGPRDDYGVHSEDPRYEEPI